MSQLRIVNKQTVRRPSEPFNSQNHNTPPRHSNVNINIEFEVMASLYAILIALSETKLKCESNVQFGNYQAKTN